MEKRYDYIDLLKCIAIFMTVSLHTGLWHTNFINNGISSFIEYCIRVVFEGVPIFILINGFLIMHKQIDIKKHFKKIIRILFILLFWSLVSVLIILLFNKTENISLNLIVNEVLNTNIANYYNGHLWFLQSLLVLYIVYPVIKVVYDKDRRIYNILFVLVIFFTFLPNLLITLKDLTNFNILSEINNFIVRLNPFRENIFLFYFMFGNYLYEKNDKISKNSKKIIIISIIIYVFIILLSLFIFKHNSIKFKDNYFYGSIFLTIIILGLFTISKFYKPKRVNLITKVINSLGKNTLGIYLIHFMITKIFNNYFAISSYNFLTRLSYTIFVITISYILTIIIKKIPLLKKSIAI